APRHAPPSPASGLATAQQLSPRAPHGPVASAAASLAFGASAGRVPSTVPPASDGVLPSSVRQNLSDGKVPDEGDAADAEARAGGGEDGVEGAALHRSYLARFRAARQEARGCPWTP